MRKLRGALICLPVILLLQWATSFWWWILVVPAVYGVVAALSGWDAFRSGMLGAGGLWLIAAGWQIATASRLVTERIAEMLGVGSPWTVLAATVLLAMIAGGLAGATGYSLRAVLRPSARNAA
jgi:hypothetical protein